jgi:hypothetical protein
MKVPQFKDLPIRSDAPPGSAWGVFDQGARRDVLGTLNFITPEVVVATREEIRTGESTVLKLVLHPFIRQLLSLMQARQSSPSSALPL